MASDVADVYRPNPSPPTLDAGPEGGHGDGDDASPADAGSEAVARSICAGSFDASCPPMLPEAGASCAPPGPNSVGALFLCEYGNDPRLGCNFEATCDADGGGWIVLTPSDAGGACGPMPAMCPPSFAAAESNAGAPCTGNDICSYGGGTCGCIASHGSGGGSTWTCAAPPPDSGCPSERPLSGAECGAQEALCHYGATCSALSGPAMACCGDTWQPINVTPPCPPPPATPED